MTKRQKIFYRVGQGAALVLVGAWFWWSGIEGDYVTGPRLPQPETGHIIPHQTKGVTVYITASDQKLQERLVYVMIGAGIIVLLCLIPSGEVPWSRKPRA